jgi:hypothetical protein
MRKRSCLLGASARLLPLALCLYAGAARAQESPDAAAAPLPTATAPAAAATPTPAVPAAGGDAPARLSAEKTTPLTVPRLAEAPVIDGRLDDAVWKTAVVLRNFYQTNPGDNVAPSKPTEVLLGFDKKNLYVAFRCFDDPSKVRATIAKRDQIFDDDNVGIYLDTFNDQRKAYVLAFNPLGIQADGVHTEGSGGDFSVDLVMESKGVITDEGYAVEVAIPFASLRYEAGEGKLWGVHFVRQAKHFNDETDSWMPLARDNSSLLSQAGHITGLVGISGERMLEVIPTVAFSERGRRVLANRPTAPLPVDATVPATRFVNGPVEARPGLNVKYGFTPNVTLDFTLNPDFGEVEADQPVVQANQRFAIFFPEKRPFFLEGIDIFQTPLTAVNTRAIVSPDYAAKLTGKSGRNTFGLLFASDNAPGNFSEEERKDPANAKFLDKNAYIGVLRLKRDIGKESSLGLVATSYNFIEDHNQLGGFDGRFRLNPQTVFTFQVLGTTSRRYFFDPDKGESVYRTGNALGYSYNFDYTGRNFGYNFFGEGRTRDYRADVGFTQRTNTNFDGLFLRLSSDPDAKRFVISKRLTNYTYTNFDWQGRMQGWSNETQARFDMARQTYLGFGVNGGYERLFEEEFGAKRAPGRAGAFRGDDPERATNRATFFVFGGATPSQKYSANFYTSYTRNAFDYDFGAGPRFPRVSPAALLDPNAARDPGVGDQFFLSASLNYQPTTALRTSFDYIKSRLERADTGRTAYDVNLFTLRGTYRFTPFTFARARVDYDTLAANIRGEFLLGWTPKPGTAFYVGYNNDLSRDGYSYLTNRFEPGVQRNGQTFFVKLSYLFRRSY